MTLETKNNIRILTPSEGMWLCNATDHVISDKVYLGINADETVWTEIEESEKESLESKWMNEEEPTDEDYSEAGKILLGVSE